MNQYISEIIFEIPVFISTVKVMSLSLLMYQKGVISSWETIDQHPWILDIVLKTVTNMEAMSDIYLHHPSHDV